MAGGVRLCTAARPADLPRCRGAGIAFLQMRRVAGSGRRPLRAVGAVAPERRKAVSSRRSECPAASS